MNILFVFSQQNSINPKKPLKGQDDVQIGISILSAVLKNKGHHTSLVVLDRRFGKRNYRTVAELIGQTKPSIICFTAVYSEYNFIATIAQFVKKAFPDIFFVIGGVHVTLNPSSEILETFDAFCIGEGEIPLSTLISQLESGKQSAEIPGMWIKTSEKINQALPGAFYSNLDELPFPDREIWQPWILNTDTRFTILLGRGCPYNCTYCCNHKLRKTATGNYVRLRSPENIIAEISQLNAQFPNVGEIYLEIETLGVDMQWVDELCSGIQEFNLSLEKPIAFGTNLRIYPNMDLDPIFVMLAKANITSVTIGLESGSERVRRQVLNRLYSNDNIIKAVQKAREHGIKVGIFNMVGLPTETPEDFNETLRMNQLLKPDWHATSIFYPYQGTELYNWVESHGLLPEKLNSENERQIARLYLPTFPQKKVQRAFDQFHYLVYKASTKKNKLKLLMYFIQQYLGHNRMAKTKRLLINILYKSGLSGIAKRLKLFRIIQSI